MDRRRSDDGSDHKTLNIISTFVGKTVTCEVTVAEPDGSNPETRTAIYNKAIELGVEIKKPEVLTPEKERGHRRRRYLHPRNQRDYCC